MRRRRLLRAGALFPRVIVGERRVVGASLRPPRYVLDLVNKDFTSMESVKEVLDKWETRGGAAYGVDGESQHAGDASGAHGSRRSDRVHGGRV